MRIIRFLSGDQVHFGQQIDPDTRTAKLIDGDLFGPHRVTDKTIVVEKLLAPLIPTDILCIGLNYRDHAAESASAIPEVPMLFIKASNTLNHPNDPVMIPRRSTMIDYEGELVIVIGKAAKNVSREDALSHVFGYTIGNDVSARDWQKEKKLGGGQFARGKSFDGFCPLGPAIVTRDEVPDPNNLKLRTLLNGQVMQDHTTSDMIFDVAEIISSLSSTLTLRPGAVIMTGTPHGVGFARTPPVWMRAGDTVSVEIESLGTLTNPIVNE